MVYSGIHPLSSSNSGSQCSASPQQNYFVVVAIDFGTTYSGYAFCFTQDPDNIHMMRNWECKYNNSYFFIMKNVEKFFLTCSRWYFFKQWVLFLNLQEQVQCRKYGIQQKIATAIIDQNDDICSMLLPLRKKTQSWVITLPSFDEVVIFRKSLLSKGNRINTKATNAA